MNIHVITPPPSTMLRGRKPSKGMSICADAGVALADLDVHLITSPAVRLDLAADRKSFEETIAIQGNKWPCK